MSKNLSVSLSVKLQGSALRDLGSQFKTLTKETYSYTAAVAKANKENLTLAATFKLLITEGKGVASVLGQLSGQSTLLGGRSRTLSGDVNLVGRSLQNGARDAERMRRELERLRQVPPPRPLPPNGGGSGGGNAGGGGTGGSSNGLVNAAALGLLPVIYQAKKITDYDRALADAANVAFAEQGSNDRIAGKSILNEKVLTAARYGGVTREQSLETYNAIISQGVEGFKGQDAARALPLFLRTATAANANPTEIANIALKSVQSLGLGKEQSPQVLEMALKAGQEGGFELKDMAKWLPEQMAYMRKAGVGGMDGLASVMAANQLSLITAGTTDAAGNNMVNLLGKINSSDTANDLKKLDIDLGGRLANAKGKGKNGLEAFVELADGVAAKDPRLQKLQKEMASSKTPEEKRKLMAEQADILHGSAIGKIVQDRQAMSALVALMYNREKYAEIKKAVIEAQNSGGIDKNYSVVADTASAKFGGLTTEVNNAFYGALDPSIKKLGEFAESTANVMKEYPTLSKYVVGTGAALSTLAAVTALMSMVTGKNLLAAAMANTGLIGFATRLGAMTLGMVAAGAAGYAVGTALRDVTGFAMDKFGLGNLATEIDNSFGHGIALILARFGVKEAEGAVNNSREAQQNEYNQQHNESEKLINGMVERMGLVPVNFNANIQVDGQTLATIVQSHQMKDFRRN